MRSRGSWHLTPAAVATTARAACIQLFVAVTRPRLGSLHCPFDSSMRPPRLTASDGMLAASVVSLWRCPPLIFSLLSKVHPLTSLIQFCFASYTKLAGVDPLRPFAMSSFSLRHPPFPFCECGPTAWIRVLPIGAFHTSLQNLTVLVLISGVSTQLPTLSFHQPSAKLFGSSFAVTLWTGIHTLANLVGCRSVNLVPTRTTQQPVAAPTAANCPVEDQNHAFHCGPSPRGRAEIDTRPCPSLPTTPGLSAF